MTMGCVSVVLVHWNQPERCATTAQQFLDSDAVATVTVVDNGSRPNERERLAALLDPAVDVIEVGFNSGFGPAANRGWERWLADPTGTEWSILAPHDVLVDPGTINKMLLAIGQHHDVGLLSADVGDHARPVVDHVFGPILKPSGGTEGFEAVDYPHGTFMMASRTCLTEVGLFDERYFAYCEEADLGLRARKAGFEVGLVRGATVHNPTVSTAAPAADYLMERNTILLMADHFGRRKAVLRFALMVWHFVTGLVSPSRRNPYWSAPARRQAIADVLGRRWGAPPSYLFG